MKPIILTSRNINNLKLYNKPGLLYIYGDWCHFCKQFQPDFFKLADLFTDNGDFLITQIESSEIENSNVKNIIGNIQGFPTLLFFDKNGKIINNYQGERTIQALLKYICQIYKFCIKN